MPKVSLDQGLMNFRILIRLGPFYVRKHYGPIGTINPLLLAMDHGVECSCAINREMIIVEGHAAQHQPY